MTSGPTLLMTPCSSVSGAWCVAVPYADMGLRERSGMQRAMPKSAALALKPLGAAGLPASSTLPAAKTQEPTASITVYPS